MLTATEIEAYNIIIENLKKIQYKYVVKGNKEREKIQQPYVTYKGDKYYSENDLMEAYACDMMSSSIYDKLLLKLSDKLDDNRAYTHSEMISIEINKFIVNLSRDLQADELQKKHQNEIDNRMKQLTEEGYSIREAETIVGNEELMRYE